LIAILTVIILLHQSSQILPDPAIFQKWIHSYEEDTPGFKVYRPSSFDFPPGWSRKGMEFQQDGDFILYDIAPNDMRVEVQGNWEPMSNNNLKISFPSGKKESYILEIEKLKPNILKIRNHEKTLD
jgi:hypothetical protein